MKHIFLITIFFAFSAFANISTVDIELVSQSSTCKGFAENLLVCNPAFCALNMKNSNNESFSLNCKISGKKKDNACKVFISYKSKKTVTVHQILINQQEAKELAGSISEISSKKNFKMTREDNCCAKDPTKKTYCDFKIDDKVFKNISDSSIYFDCFGRPALPLKKKTIDYN